MPEFPLAELELKRLTASRTALLLRIVPPVLCGVLVGLFGLASMGERGDAGEIANTTSAMVFALATFGQAAIVLLYSPLFASTLLSREREHHTLQLLLLADFRASNIYFAKFVAVFAVSQILIASALPLLAIASLLGGLSLAGIAANVAAFSALNFLTLTVSLLFSAAATRAMDAYIRGAVVLILLFGGLVAVDFTWNFSLFVSPGRTLLLAMDRKLDPSVLFAGAAWALAIGSLFACATIVLLQGLAKGEQPRRAAAKLFKSRKRRRLRRVKEHVRALYAAAATSAAGTWMSFPRVIVVLAVACFAASVLPPLVFALPFLIIYDATASITGAVNSGALGELLLTGHPVKRLARDIIRVHFRRTLLFGLLTVPLVAVPIYVIALASLADSIGFLWPPTLIVFCVLGVAATAGKIMFLCAIGCYEATYPGTPLRRAVRGLFYSWAAAILVTMGCGYNLFLLHLIGTNLPEGTGQRIYIHIEMLLVFVLPGIVYFQLARFWMRSFETALMRRMGL